jgi:hypothetical protein
MKYDSYRAEVFKPKNNTVKSVLRRDSLVWLDGAWFVKNGKSRGRLA